jgi:hypothetical protein
MSQQSYVDKILPIYCEAMVMLREKYPPPPGIKWLLVEDGDRSHGMTKPGLAQQLKDRYSIKNLSHPTQSPDLNPHEGSWGILKPRSRRYLYIEMAEWETLFQLKDILDSIWRCIRQEEIQKRIAEMPSRLQTSNKMA